MLRRRHRPVCCPPPLVFCGVLLALLANAACSDRRSPAPRGTAAPGPATLSGTDAALPAAYPHAPIVLLSIDTLRSDRLPAYGYAAGSTPAIDRLARDGVLFERAYSHVPLTLPSHASLFSGLLPPAHGVRDNLGYHFDGASLPSLPRSLQQLGYATGGAISAYVLHSKLGIGEGFDRFEDDIPFDPEVGAGALQRPGSATLERILPWLREVAGQPFFLFLHLYEPHTPYEPPPPFASRFPDPYDGEVAAADAVVGQLLDELDRLGVYDEAIVALLSDHGEGLGDHGEEEHGVLLHREALQVPLILKLPDALRAGTRIFRSVGLIDVFPTLLSLVGGDAAALELPGTDLLAEPADSERPLYAETFYPRLHLGWSEAASLIRGRYHYLEGPDPELYDLIVDPTEQHNLIHQERRQLADLRQRLAAIDRSLSPPEEVDEETRGALAALGYVGAASDLEDGPLPNPKGRLGTLEDLKGGFRLYRERRYQEAAGAFAAAIEDNPRLLDAWEYRGRCLQRLGRHREAAEALEAALHLSDRIPNLAVTAALSRLEAREPAAARAVLDAELLRNPSYLPLHLLRSRVLLIQGDLSAAGDDAETALTLAPDNADAIYQRGVVRMAERRFDEAESDLRAALERSPQHLAAMSDLAVLLMNRGDQREARQLLERLLELNPRDVMARRHLASLSR